jgi:hypothetical protein
MPKEGKGKRGRQQRREKKAQAKATTEKPVVDGRAIKAKVKATQKAADTAQLVEVSEKWVADGRVTKVVVKGRGITARVGSAGTWGIKQTSVGGFMG